MTGQRRTKLTVQISAETAQAARAAAVGMQQRVSPNYTLGQLVEDAVREHVRRLEADHHDGTPWPVSDAPLRPGARLGGRAPHEGSR